MAQKVKNLPAMQGPLPGSGRSPGEGIGNPLQDSCLGNPMQRSLAGYSLGGHKELDTTEGLTLSQGGRNLGLNPFSLCGSMRNFPFWTTVSLNLSTKNKKPPKLVMELNKIMCNSLVENSYDQYVFICMLSHPTKDF